MSSIGCRRTLLFIEGLISHNQSFHSKISGKRGKATKSGPERSNTGTGAKTTKEYRNENWGRASQEPDSQATPVHLALSTTPEPSSQSKSLTLSGIWKSRRPKGRPIPEIRPPPRATLTAGAWKDGTAPPEFIIDLELPPERRWAAAVEWGITPLRTMVSKLPVPEDDAYFWENGLMRTLERRYSFSNEQYAEMQGISAQSGIPFHRIVDFNQTLNSQFGCTSGTAPLSHSERLAHFRVLDSNYAMAHLLIQAHFVRRGELVASAIMNLGHVAITTGVRPGLSISINTKDDYSRSSWGWRKAVQGIGWALYDPWFITTRDLLLREKLPSLRTAKWELSLGQPQAYFAVVSDGLDSSSLDVRWESGPAWREAKSGVLVQGNHYADHDSKIMLDALLPNHGRRREKSQARVNRLKNDIDQSMRRNEGRGTRLSELTNWVTSQPVKHEATTLSCIMDPTEGNIIWSAAYRGRL